MARAVVLDCDTGTDDAVAIMIAALHPELDLLGVCAVFGNADVASTARASREALAVAGRPDLPVVAGAAGHLAGQPDPSAARWLAQTLRARPATVVATGPLTNLALALAVDAALVEGVEELVVLGGSHAVGNVTPAAERNFWNDPPAAAAVLAAPWRRLVLVTIDATCGVPFDRAYAVSLRALGTPAGAAAAGFLEARIEAYRGFSRMRGREAAPLHDPLAVAYLLDPQVLTLRHLHVAVETRGRLTAGRSVIDVDAVGGEPPNAFVALEADGVRFARLVSTALAGH